MQSSSTSPAPLEAIRERIRKRRLAADSLAEDCERHRQALDANDRRRNAIRDQLMSSAEMPKARDDAFHDALMRLEDDRANLQRNFAEAEQRLADAKSELERMNGEIERLERQPLSVSTTTYDCADTASEAQHSDDETEQPACTSQTHAPSEQEVKVGDKVYVTRDELYRPAHVRWYVWRYCFYCK